VSKRETDNLRIGLFGGTFDPPHMGHLILAEVFYEKYRLDRLLFLPAHIPPHKMQVASSPVQDRLAMVRLSTRSHPAFEVDDSEIRRGGISYTVDTLRWLSEKHTLTRQNLYFLIGGDSLADLHSWRRPEEILTLATIVVARRPEAELAAVSDEFKSQVRFLDAPQISLSSQWIREQVRSGQPFESYVLPEVADYIRKHHLYQPQ